MPSVNFQPEALHELFRREKVVTRKQILSHLGCSSMTAWRRLRQSGYFSSISHNAAYYTAADVPAFDSDGLWSYRGIRFSRSRTLPATVIALVENSDAGMDGRALNQRLEANIAPILSALWRDRRLSRDQVRGRFVYFAVDADRRAVQMATRQATTELMEPSALAAPETVIAVLVALLLGASRKRRVLARRLRRKGVEVTAAQIEAIFTHYGLSKKNA